MTEAEALQAIVKYKLAVIFDEDGFDDDLDVVWCVGLTERGFYIAYDDYEDASDVYDAILDGHLDDVVIGKTLPETVQKWVEKYGEKHNAT